MLALKVELFSFSYRHPIFLTSAPSLIVPPLTTIYGLFAAILGKGKNDVMENRKIIKREIQDKIEKIDIFFSRLPKFYEFGIMRFNVDETKQKKNWFTPMTYCYGFNFDIYIILSSPAIEKELESSISTSTAKYTPYVGSSENIVKSLEIVDEKSVKENSRWVLKKIENINDYVIPKNKIFYLLNLPSGYDEEGKWIFGNFVLEEL